MDDGHVFPQSGNYPLDGGVIGVVVTRVCTGSWAGPPLSPVAVTALSGVGSAPQLLK